MTAKSKRLVKALTIMIISLVATAFIVSGEHLEVIAKL